MNTIRVEDQPAFPGNRELERKIKSLVRWNAMAMVLKANKNTNVGGHISTFASAATLYEIGQNHFFRGRGETNTPATWCSSRGTPAPACTPARSSKGGSTRAS